MNVDRRINKCLRCGKNMTWRERRYQFGRIIRHGISFEDAKELMPKCQKCVTLALTKDLVMPVLHREH